MAKWTGEIILADFLPIEKPTGEIKIKVYIPANVTPEIEETLQGVEESITYEDVKRWNEKKKEIKQRFLDDFHWSGTYVDNRLNRRLERVGKSKAHLNKLVNVTNDEHLKEALDKINRYTPRRRDVILTEAFNRSEKVDELPDNITSSGEDLNTLLRKIREVGIVETPVMVNPKTGQPMTFEDFEDIKERRKFGAEWFEE